MDTNNERKCYLWGNPHDVLKQIYEVVGDGKSGHRYISEKQVADIACNLSLLGFDCHLSFFRNSERRERLISFYFNAGEDNQFSSRMPEGGDEYTAKELKDLADFITKHTGKDGLFHFSYSM